MSSYDENSPLSRLIKKIKKEVNLLDFAIEYYDFIPDSNNKCLNEGHIEKTDSMAYWEENNTFHCFGCGENFDIIRLVSIKENLGADGEDFIKIIKFICEKVGYEMTTTQMNYDPNFKAKALIIEQRTALSIGYADNLWKESGAFARDYLFGRGFTKQTIVDFYLGVTGEQEDRVGIGGVNNRISIPMLDDKGLKTLGFTFREIYQSDGKYKYLNTENDITFKKSEHLFGLSNALTAVKNTGHMYLVEGPLDVLSMHQIGFKNTVAYRQASIAEGQVTVLINLIKKKVLRNITIILDQDKAGVITGFPKSLDRLLKTGANISVVPTLRYEGKDMNDVCNNYKWDGRKVAALLNDCTRDAVEYYLSNMLGTYDTRVITMSEQIRRVSDGVIQQIPDKFKREVLTRMVESRIKY